MTVEQAYEIRRQIALIELPFAFSTSVFFAPFKTYGIPSISALLVKTGQLADDTTSSKRLANTSVLLTEISFHHPAATRAVEGIARMNYLHAGYRAAGKISDADMLYTLSLFALEAPRWINQYEWRPLSQVELCAIGTYWHYMAGMMEIPLEALPSSPEWLDGLAFLDELRSWSIGYELQNMHSAATNKIMGDSTLRIGLYNMPRVLHKLVMGLYAAIMQPHVRIAMGLDEPSPWLSKCLHLFIKVRKFVLLHFLLPRPHFLRKRWFSEHANAHGKYNAKEFFSLPWYVEPTLLERWGLGAWYLRALGSKVPGDDENKYFPDGYNILDVGPDKLVGKGKTDMAKTFEHIRTSQRLQCPFRA